MFKSVLGSFVNPTTDSTEFDKPRRSHRDGRRRVTPDPSVYISDFDFSTTADDQLLMQVKSQLSRRRNLRRRLQRKRIIQMAKTRKNNKTGLQKPFLLEI